MNRQRLQVNKWREGSPGCSFSMANEWNSFNNIHDWHRCKIHPQLFHILWNENNVIPKDQRNRFYFLLVEKKNHHFSSWLSPHLMNLLVASRMYQASCEGKHRLVKGIEKRKKKFPQNFSPSSDYTPWSIHQRNEPLRKERGKFFLIHVIKSRVEIKLTISFH